MTEPTSTPAGPAAASDEGPAADPFEPGPASLSGCGKPAVIGCLVLLALLAVSLVLLVSQSQRLMIYLLGQMRTQVTAALPEDLSAAERERLDAAFDSAIAAVGEGRFDASSMTHLQRVAGAVPGRGETLTGEQVEEITLSLEAIGAVASPEPEDAPVAPADPQASRIRLWP